MKMGEYSGYDALKLFKLIDRAMVRIEELKNEKEELNYPLKLNTSKEQVENRKKEINKTIDKLEAGILEIQSELRKR